MIVTDGAAITGTRETALGFLLVDARFARTGIQVYGGGELGRPELGTVRVWRPEAEVFGDAAMASFAHRPVTDDHPAAPVDASTWRDHAVGMTGDTVARDGDHVRISFALMDAAAIAAVRDGKRELSAGYCADLDWTAGTTPDGEPYDAAMRNIRGNHLAIVTRGRAGATCRIGDGWEQRQQEDRTMPGETMRAVMVDGITIQTTDQGAQVIERLQQQLADARRTAEAAAGTHAAALDAANGKLAAKEAELADALKRVPDAAALDALVAGRTATIEAARRLLGDGFDPAGKADAQIKRAVVAKRLGDAMVAGKSDDYVAAAYDAIAAQAPSSDPVRDALRTAQQPVGDARGEADKAYRKNVKSLTTRWKGDA